MLDTVTGKMLLTTIKKTNKGQLAATEIPAL